MSYSLLLTLLLQFSTAVSANDSPEERLNDVTSEIKTLASEISKKKASKAEIYLEIEQQEKAISTISRKLVKLNEQVQQQSLLIKKLEQQQQIQRKVQQQQILALEKQLRAAYIHSQSNYLRILLNQQNPADISRSLVYYRYFHQAHEQQLKQITVLLETLAEDQKVLQLEQDNYQQIYTSQQRQQAELKRHSQDRQALISLLDQQISSQDVKLANLQEEQQSLSKLLESIAKKAAAKTQKSKLKHEPFRKLRGQLNWPLSGKVIAHYGASRNIGKLKWQGIMISAPPGKDVVSVATGTIVFSDWMRGFGLLLIIDHGDQYMTLYGNNRTLFKQTGEKVSAGELIAQSGEKGPQQYAGLYFEVRHKGKPTNPQKWLIR